MHSAHFIAFVMIKLRHVIHQQVSMSLITRNGGINAPYALIVVLGMTPETRQTGMERNHPTIRIFDHRLPF